MQTKTDYQQFCSTINQITRDNIRPRLLLHSCCAPCTSQVLACLHPYFDITLLFYNPNIDTQSEYDYRAKELQKLIQTAPFGKGVKLITMTHESQRFYRMAKGLEELPEGGERCFGCYTMRLEKTAQCAKEQQFDYFCTTLSISPLKNAAKLNQIGRQLEKQWGVTYLVSDFKKQEGYKKSVEYSKTYSLYRQNYCGCAFSKPKIND